MFTGIVEEIGRLAAVERRGGPDAASARLHITCATVVEDAAEGDTLAPALGPDWSLTALTPETGWLESSRGPRYRISLWTRQD